MDWKTLLTEYRDSSTKKRSRHDLRTEFQKDYHRIIISASFRRLQDKTQVFPLNRGDFVRTRLTHSLEVSSIAKSMAIAALSKVCEKKLDDTVDAEVIRNASDILECAGLLHDIGNPPFGHFGEDMIRSWFSENLDRLSFQGHTASELLDAQMKADLLNFEGNAQALRLLTKLHYLLDDNGMHLTYALLGTIIKYPVSSLEIVPDGSSIKAKKLGYYKAEQTIYQSIANQTGTAGYRNPLTFLLEAADDIAYKTADIEDAVKKGMISIHHITSDMLEFKANIKDDAEDIDHAITLLETCRKDSEKRQNTLDKDINAVQNWLIKIQAMLIDSTVESFATHYADIMSGKLDKELLNIGKCKNIVSILGKIAKNRVFKSDFIIKQEISVGAILNTLMDKFVPACLNYNFDKPQKTLDNMLMYIVSENYKNTYIKHSKDASLSEQMYLRLLLVTDFICGMTDTYAKNLFRDLTGNV